MPSAPNWGQQEREKKENPELLGEGQSYGLVKQKVTLNDKKKLRTLINEKFNDIYKKN
jgi:hypothetical protein